MFICVVVIIIWICIVQYNVFILISYASITILFIYTVSVSQHFFDVSDRFLVHRYSVLQQHAEANGIEGVDDLDTLEVGKTHYHDDSDEVQTSPLC